jgi:hypothetical protein
MKEITEPRDALEKSKGLQYTVTTKVLIHQRERQFIFQRPFTPKEDGIFFPTILLNAHQSNTKSSIKYLAIHPMQ